MATVYRIPAYATIAGASRQMEYYIFTSSIIYEKIKNTTSYETLMNSTGTFTDVAEELKIFFGDSLINYNMQVYCGLTQNQGRPTDPFFQTALNKLGMSPNYPQPVTYEYYPLFTNVFLVNGGINMPDNACGYNQGSGIIRYGSISPFFCDGTSTYVNRNFNQIYLQFTVFPDDAFDGNGGVSAKYLEDPTLVFPNIRIRVNFDSDAATASQILVTRSSGFTSGAVNTTLTGVKVGGAGTLVDDTDNPYGSHGTSGPGGGNGSYGDIDGIEATDIPELPDVNAASLGLITLYNPTSSIINQLASYLWSGMFDPDSFKKLFADPMGCLIGLSIVPAIPSTLGSKNIMFGNIDSGISCPYLASNYCNVDCGSVSIEEYVGSFLDYEPYVKISIFLPYIGFVKLSADDVMGGSINVQYNIDVLSGNLTAFIKHSTKGVLYSYSGSCLTNIPITSQSFTGALQSYYTSLMGVAGSAIGSLGSGGAGLAAVGNSIATAAMDTMFSMKPDFQRSGSVGGASGILGVQTPFIVIERPRFSVPYHVQRYAGQTSNITSYLSDCHGFTLVDHVHIDGVSATSEEIKEIEALLKEGVIL